MVLSCEKTEDGLWAVVLDRTLFHPQGGGQPSDAGTINSVVIKKVIHAEKDIIHLAEDAVSGEVSLRVDDRKDVCTLGCIQRVT